jgi:hypothetical protein
MCLETQRLASKEEILNNAIIVKSNADTAFNLYKHYASAVPTLAANCKW